MSSHVPGAVSDGERGARGLLTPSSCLNVPFYSRMRRDLLGEARKTRQTVMDETQHRHLTALPGAHGTVYNA